MFKKSEKNPHFWQSSELPFVKYLLVFIPVFSLFFFLLYDDCSRELDRICREALSHIEGVVKNDLQTANDIIVRYGQQISDYDKPSIQDITRIIGTRDKKRFHWINIGWADVENKIIYDQNNHHSVTNYFDASNRRYMKMCHRQPTQVHISQAIHATSLGVRCIPGGYGVVNKKNEYIGTVWFALRIDELSDRINQYLHTSKVSYVLLDEDLKIVSSYPNTFFNLNFYESTFFQEQLGSALFTDYEGVLKNSLKVDNTIFNLYKKVNGYPFYIIVGVDKYAKLYFFLMKLFPFLGISFSILISGLLFSFLATKKTLNRAAYSNFLKAKIKQQVFQRQQEFLSRIRNEVLRPMVYNNLTRYGLEKEEWEIFFDQIDENVKFPKPSVEKFIDVAELTNQTLQAFWVEFKKRQIHVQAKFSKTIEPFLTDPLVFQIILSNIVFLIIDGNLKKKKIKICIKQAEFGNQKFLIMEFFFKGDIVSNLKLFQKECAVSYELCSLELRFTDLLKVIIDLEGTAPFFNHGDSIILRLPYRKESEPAEPDGDFAHNEGGKVVPFPKS